MTGAMTAAIAGLKTHMQKLNVIGNNIANVNTYGYKAQRTIFSESLYTTMYGGSDGTTTVGGNNPSQVGYGVTLGAISMNMTTASYFSTGYTTDCMIDGDGFFLVGNKDVVIDAEDPNSLKNLTLTRVGDFYFGPDGYLVDNKGSCVYGFLTTGVDDDGNYITSDMLVPIRLPMMGIADGDTVPTVQWPEFDETAGTLVDAAGTDANPFSRVSLDTVSISENGKITGMTKDTEEQITIGYLALGNVTNPNGVSHQSGPYYKAMDGAGELAITLMGGLAADLGIYFVNGTVAAGGTENAGEDFEGLDAMYVGSAGDVSLITGGLEMSGTDLATEISEMITTQRGYQANTRIITVTDSMLEELVNIKR